MINVNQLTSELRMMPDQALQRMAMMYKNDPYIFPMVISEDMARKKLRQAAQAQAVQPQPTVKDQALMSMGEPPAPAPGIAALQAPNLANMADGGIAGADEIATYAEGGNVVMAPGSTPSYQRTAMFPGMLDFAQHSEPVIRMAGGGAVARYADEGLVRPKQGPYPGLAQYGDLATGQARSGTLLPATTGYEGMSIDEFVRAAYNDVSDYLKGLYGKIPKESWAQEAAKDLAEKKRREAGERAMRPAANMPRRTPRTLAMEEAELAARAPKPADTTAAVAEPLREPPLRNEYGDEYQQVSAAPTGAAPAGGLREPPKTAFTAAQEAAGRAPAVPTAPARPGESDVAKAKRAAGEFFDENAVKGDVETYVARTKQNIAEGRGRVEQALKKEGKAYEGLESLLKQEEVDAKKGLDQDKAMAILNAGLAMMAGTSPRALENIGKGAMVGTGQYAEAMKDFKKAAKERQRAMADIEQARRAEARDDTKTMLRYEESAEARLDNAENFGIKAIMDVTNARAGAAANIYKGMQDNAAAMQRVQVQEAGAAARQQQELGSRAGIAQMDALVRLQLANMPGTEERLIRAFGTDPAFRKAYEEFRSLGADQKALQDLLVRIATSPGGMQILKQQEPELYNTLQAYSSRLSGAGIQAVGSVPQGAGVRP